MDIGMWISHLAATPRSAGIRGSRCTALIHPSASEPSGGASLLLSYPTSELRKWASAGVTVQQRWCITTALLPYEWAEKVSEWGRNSAAAVVIFLAHFGPLNTNWALFNHHGLPEYYCWPCHPFMTTVYHLLMYFQQDNAPCHKAQIISDWFLEHDNKFTLLKWPPQSPDLNPTEHYGMWWNERFTSWMCRRQICSNCVMLSCQYELKSLRNVFSTLLNLYHEELRQFWRQKWVQPGTSKVYLIKSPKSRQKVYFAIFCLKEVH